MRKYFVMLFLINLCACSTTFGDQPRFGMKFKEPYSGFVGGGTHSGLDLDVPLNTPVRSINDGEVIFASHVNFQGVKTNLVAIKHQDGTISRYIHIDKISVKSYDKVTKGQQIAVTALNGPAGPNTNRIVPYPHLHLEIYRDGALIDPMLLRMSCKDSSWLWPVGCF